MNSCLTGKGGGGGSWGCVCNRRRGSVDPFDGDSGRTGGIENLSLLPHREKEGRFYACFLQRRRLLRDKRGVSCFFFLPKGERRKREGKEDLRCQVTRNRRRQAYRRKTELREETAQYLNVLAEREEGRGKES